MPGAVYLSQPIGLGSDRFKIGCSASQFLPRYLIAFDCGDHFAVKRVVKAHFKAKFRLFAGYDYFEGPAAEVKALFLHIVAPLALPSTRVLLLPVVSPCNLSPTISATGATDAIIAKLTQACAEAIIAKQRQALKLATDQLRELFI